MTGVADTAEQAAGAAREMLDLFEADRRRVEALGRPAGSVLRVHPLLQTHPILKIPDAAKRLGVTAPTARAAVRHLETLGLLREVTGKRRGQAFVYAAYLSILERGTEPLPR